MMSVSRFLRRHETVIKARQVWRALSSQTDGETRIAQILKEKFPQAASLKVVDISAKCTSNLLYRYCLRPHHPEGARSWKPRVGPGGCGAMYEIHIESEEFKGKRTVQQHQLVNQALQDEIQGMHGLRIFTDVPRK